MANWISKMLNGSGSDPAALKAALTEAGRDQAERRANVKKLQERVHQGYQEGLDNKKLRAIESELDDEERELKKLDAALPDLRSELSAAQAAAAKRAEDEAGSKYLDLAERSAAALEACDVAFVEQRLFWDKNQHLLRRSVEPLGCAVILGEGHGIAWAIQTRKHIGQARATRARRDNPQPAPRPPAIALPQTAHEDRPRLPHERQRLTDSQHEVSLSFARDARQSASRTPDDLTPLQVDEVRVRALRHGYSPREDLPQCAYGQIVRMPRGAAERAANSGAVEILEIYGDTSRSLRTVGKPEAPSGTAREP